MRVLASSPLMMWLMAALSASGRWLAMPMRWVSSPGSLKRRRGALSMSGSKKPPRQLAFLFPEPDPQPGNARFIVDTKGNITDVKAVAQDARVFDRLPPPASAPKRTGSSSVRAARPS